MEKQSLELQSLQMPKFMGILNITSDSFSDGGLYLDLDSAMRKVDDLVNQGADIIDVGGESTRPGSKEVSEYTELKRVIPVLERIRFKHPETVVSIDTRKAKVAREAIQTGVNIVNDISALQHDPEMIRIIAENPSTQVILMHMQGSPDIMQKDPQYNNVMDDISAFFQKRLSTLDSFGIDRSRVMLDPGIGFGKTLAHNVQLLTHLNAFKHFACPLMIGASRKSFISAIDASPPDERIGGSIAAALICSLQEVAILRVHDVQAHKQFFKVLVHLLGNS